MTVPEKAISIGPMPHNDVAQASGIVRHAFATHLGTDAEVFWRDRDPVIGRWNSCPSFSYTAVLNDSPGTPPYFSVRIATRSPSR